MTLRVEPSELDSAAARYEASAYTVATVAEELPGTVHAGSATPALVGMLAQAATDLAGLVQALGVIAGILASCADAYRDADAETAAGLVASWVDQGE